MALALGLLETRGLIAAIEAADAMAKASNIQLVGKEKTNPALVTIKVVGEVAAVRASVEAGAAAATRVGEVVSIHVIPKPDEELLIIFPEISGTPGSASDPRKRKKVQDRVIPPVNELAEESGISNEIVPVSTGNEEINPDYSPTSESDSATETFAPREDTRSIEQPDLAGENPNEDETGDSGDYVPVGEAQPKNIHQEPQYIPIEEEMPPIEMEYYSPLPAQKDNETEELEVNAEDLFTQAARYGQRKEEKPAKSHSFEDEHKSGETSSPETKEFPSGELQSGEEYPTTDIESRDVSTLNVHELRRLARTMPDFPIQGREISRASRQELLYYLQNLT